MIYPMKSRQIQGVKMDDFKVYVTRKIPESGLQMLEEGCGEVYIRESEEPVSKDELIEDISNYRGLLCLLTDSIDSEVLEAATDLRIVANYAVGYDNIDVTAASRLGIMVTNTPGILSDTTADMAWALLMSCARRVVEADGFVRSGSFKRWEPKLLLGYDVNGKTLGIIGFGRIGRTLALRASGFNMRVIYHDIERAPEGVEEELGAEYVDLDSLIASADFISLHTPLTERTHHLIAKPQLEAMKPSAILINTSRGPVVDEAALSEALGAGGIAAAGLDVFEDEPKVNPELLDLTNIVLTPHIGSASIETRAKMSEMAARNILAAMKGETPPNLVNREALG